MGMKATENFNHSTKQIPPYRFDIREDFILSGEGQQRHIRHRCLGSGLERRKQKKTVLDKHESEREKAHNRLFS